MARMKHLAYIILGASVLLSGCGPQWGFIVRPIPPDQRMKETVVLTDPGWFVTDKIAVLDLDGIILNDRSVGLFSGGENPVSAFIEKINAVSADPDVKAVVLRINSPGGGVTASDILYHELVRLKARRGVPVIACIEDIGASGAYYIACASDAILAHPTAAVGSIGVIIQTFSLSGTMRLLGVTSHAVTSGPLKDMGSPLKPLEPAELAVFQSLVDDYYARFLAVIQSGRPRLSTERVAELADGRIYSAEQALACGLIDATGYLRDAIALAKERSGSQRVKVVMYDRPWGYQPNAYASAPAPTPGAGPTNISLLHLDGASLSRFTRPQFLYLWTGAEGR